MPVHRYFAVFLALLTMPSLGRAGLHYSGEPLAELPSQWRGYLIDQRALRMASVKPAAGQQAGPLRQEYLDAAEKLEKAAQARKLTADELADLGALYVRLGEAGKAVELLRIAQREHGNHFRIAANLGTAWQLQGDLQQAANSLEEAVRLSPGKWQKAEELHLKLVRQRLKEAKDAGGLDDLFGIQFVADDGKWRPGKLAAAEAKKLPANAAAHLQTLGLWLPADGRLLWQLAELSAAHGDIHTAAAVLDGCVAEFGMSQPELRQRRLLMRAAADTAQLNPNDKTVHEGHAGALKPRSRRPLLSKFNAADLPPISDTAVNAVPWALLAETELDKNAKPTFAKYLKELDGKEVALTGFMQPLGEELDQTAFLFIEYPVGCWYCEVPEPTSIVLIEMAGGKSAKFTRGLVKVSGKLKLNATDPERFLYTIGKATIADAD